MYDKKTLFRKRHLAQKLHFEQHLNKSEIARRLGVTWGFVHKWTKDPKVQIADRRGWPKGKRRTHTKREEERLIVIRSELEERDFFYGAGKIIDEYERKFPSEPQLNRSYVNRVISQHFPMSKRKL